MHWGSVFEEKVEENDFDQSLEDAVSESSLRSLFETEERRGLQLG